MIVDETLDQIVKIFRNQINDVSREFYNISLVKGVRSFYDITVPLTELPLLMLYRTSDLFEPGSALIKRSYCKLDYVLSYESNSRALAYCNIIARIVNSSLNTIHTKVNIQKLDFENRRADYNQMGITQAVGSFLQFYFEIQESSLTPTILKGLNIK